METNWIIGILAEEGVACVLSIILIIISYRINKKRSLQSYRVPTSNVAVNRFSTNESIYDGISSETHSVSDSGYLVPVSTTPRTGVSVSLNALNSSKSVSPSSTRRENIYEAVGSNVSLNRNQNFENTPTSSNVNLYEDVSGSFQSIDNNATYQNTLGGHSNLAFQRDEKDAQY